MYNSGNLESLSRRIQLAATSPRDRFGNIAEDASRVSYEDTMKGFRTSSTRVVLPADRCPPAAAEPPARHPAAEMLRSAAITLALFHNFYSGSAASTEALPNHIRINL